MKIAFIGLGNMGGPMATNLTNAGHDVAGFDLVAQPDGVTMVESVAHACTDADVAITMLPNGANLRTVAKDVVGTLPPDGVFIDCSTVDVASARDVAADAGAAGLQMLDAPVSGLSLIHI